MVSSSGRTPTGLRLAWIESRSARFNRRAGTGSGKHARLADPPCRPGARGGPSGHLREACAPRGICSCVPVVDGGRPPWPWSSASWVPRGTRLQHLAQLGGAPGEVCVAKECRENRLDACERDAVPTLDAQAYVTSSGPHHPPGVGERPALDQDRSFHRRARGHRAKQQRAEPAATNVDRERAALAKGDLEPPTEAGPPAVLQRSFHPPNPRGNLSTAVRRRKVGLVSAAPNYPAPGRRRATGPTSPGAPSPSRSRGRRSRSPAARRSPERHAVGGRAARAAAGGFDRQGRCSRHTPHPGESFLGRLRVDRARGDRKRAARPCTNPGSRRMRALAEQRSGPRPTSANGHWPGREGEGPGAWSLPLLDRRARLHGQLPERIRPRQIPTARGWGYRPGWSTSTRPDRSGPGTSRQRIHPGRSPASRR